MAGSRKSRRPAGEVAPATEGCDVVEAPEELPEGTRGRGRRSRQADAGPARTELDQRERRQSADRKPKGPPTRRKRSADVQLEDAESTTPGIATGTSDSPTDPV
jgi:hypothetical protein